MVESDDPALLYGCAAQKHVRVAFGAEQVTTVWAPTGIAIASPFRGSASNCTGARSRRPAREPETAQRSWFDCPHETDGAVINSDTKTSRQPSVS
jgi:hypothetical protein